jgi:signal transduction histidine kinase
VVGWFAARLRLVRRRLEAAHRAHAATARAREELLAAVAHDLRSPLAGISMNAQLARRRLDRLDGPPHLTSKLASQLADVEGSARRMAAVLDDMLDVARLQSGRPLQLNLQPVQLLAVVEAVVAIHQPTTERHTLRVAASADPRGTWDSARVERVVDDLIVNAIKHSLSGGEIALDVAEEASHDGRRMAVLRVSDRGHGLTPAELNHVLERFFRPGCTHGRIAGSGIRLASAAGIAEQHGGSLSAEPQPGGGSTITLRLPV